MNSTVQDALNELIHDTFNCEDYSAGLRKWGTFTERDVEMINNDNECFIGIRVISWKPNFVTFSIDDETASMKLTHGSWEVVK